MLGGSTLLYGFLSIIGARCNAKLKAVRATVDISLQSGFFSEQRANFSGFYAQTTLNHVLLDSVYHASIYHASAMGCPSCSGSSEGLWFGSERLALQKAVCARSVLEYQTCRSSMLDLV